MLESIELNLSSPMRWSESFDLYGERRPRLSRDADLSQLHNWAVFKAKCKVCGEFTPESDSDVQAKRMHFEHCSRKHGYIFDEGTIFRVKDQQLQEIITKSDDYGLPMPGFDDHSSCIRVMSGSKSVCAVHSGNEFIDKGFNR